MEGDEAGSSESISSLCDKVEAEAKRTKRKGKLTIDPTLPPFQVVSCVSQQQPAHEVSVQQLFFWLVAAWVKSRAERPSVSVVNRQLHVQIGCKLGIRNRKDELEASKAKQITN